MPEPEIARRCQSCGASIRDRAFFCPQCGKSLKTTGELTDSDPDPDKPIPAVAAAPLNEATNEKQQLDAELSADSTGKEPELEDQETREPAAENSSGRNKGTPDRGLTNAPDQSGAKGTPATHVSAVVRSKVQRATGLARNVGGEVVQRGQKLREISGVMLDEAGYDPSLRFVLVAAVLFVLFLIIVLLNRFIV